MMALDVDGIIRHSLTEDVDMWYDHPTAGFVVRKDNITYEISNRVIVDNFRGWSHPDGVTYDNIIDFIIAKVNSMR